MLDLQYQLRMKNYHDAKHHTALHNFNIGDVVFCANMLLNKLDSQFHLGKNVIIETQGRNTFTLFNVATGTSLIPNVKHLKHAPIKKNSPTLETKKIGEVLAPSNRMLTLVRQVTAILMLV